MNRSWKLLFSHSLFLPSIQRWIAIGDTLNTAAFSLSTPAVVNVYDSVQRHPVAGWCATRSSTVDHRCGAAAVRRSYASVWPRCGRIGARPAGMAEHGNDQREKGLNGGEHRQAAGIAGKTPMGKWAFIIEPLLRGLEVGDRRQTRSDQIQHRQQNSRNRADRFRD